jgi:tetratricopeptide (TPR) repeat protein
MASAQDHKERGNAYYQRKEYDEAVAWYTKAVDLDPSQHAVYTNRAAAHFALQNYEDALSDAMASTGLNDSWTKGYYRQVGLALPGVRLVTWHILALASYI